jgi:hypothetical protein
VVVWEHNESEMYYYRAGDNNKFDLCYDPDSGQKWSYNPVRYVLRSFN